MYSSELSLHSEVAKQKGRRGAFRTLPKNWKGVADLACQLKVCEQSLCPISLLAQLLASKLNMQKAALPMMHRTSLPAAFGPVRASKWRNSYCKLKLGQPFLRSWRLYRLSGMLVLLSQQNQEMVRGWEYCHSPYSETCAPRLKIWPLVKPIRCHQHPQKCSHRTNTFLTYKRRDMTKTRTD